MKKFLFLSIFLASFAVSAQKTNEIKLDVFDILALKSLDVSYEHVLNTESSVGLSILFNFEKDASFRYKQDFALTPYYRQHLFNRGNVNFFGEFFGSINSGEELNSDDIEEDYTDFAFGLGFGGKYVSVNGFVLDIHAGIGRNLFNTDISPEIVPRVGISVGKRF
jgi:hypothetical protein